MDASEALVFDAVARFGSLSDAYSGLLKMRKAPAPTSGAPDEDTMLEALDMIWFKMSPAQRVSVREVLKDHQKDQVRAAALLGA